MDRLDRRVSDTPSWHDPGMSDCVARLARNQHGLVTKEQVRTVLTKEQLRLRLRPTPLGADSGSACIG